MSNYVIKLLETSEYSANDYYKIIHLCNQKIINIDKNRHKKLFLDKAKNIIIINNELKFFYNIIFNSLDFFIDQIDNYNQIKSIVISFDYKGNTIEYCLYEDESESVFLEEKINIINLNGHYFETYINNYEEKLIKILEFKTVSIKELNDFFKDLFVCVPVKIV